MVELNSTVGALSNIDWASVIAGVPGVGDLVNIGKALGIAALVYIIFLIIRSIVQINYSLRFKKLTQNVEEINQKMDLLVGKKIKSKKI